VEKKWKKKNHRPETKPHVEAESKQQAVVAGKR
jgi:hypothetical protein